MAKSLELIIGADIPASITRLESDLKSIKLKPLEVQEITLSNAAIANIQSQIQNAINGITYTVNLNGIPNGGLSESKTIGFGFAESLKDYQSMLNSKNYLGDLRKLNLPQEQIDSFVEKLREAQAAFRDLGKEDGSGFAEITIEKARELVSLYNDVRRSFEALKAQGPMGDPIPDNVLRKFELLRNSLLKIQDGAYTGALDTSTYAAKMTRMGIPAEDQTPVLDRLGDLGQRMLKINVDTATKTELSDLISEFNEINSLITNLSKKYINPKIAESAEISASKLSSRISDLLAKYPRLEQQMPTAYNQLIDLQNRISSAKTPDDVRHLANEFTKLEAGIKGAGVQAETLGDKIKKRVVSQLGNMMVSYAVMALRKAFRDLYQAVSDVDKAMTELRKVTDLTAASYDSFLKRASSGAKEIGASISDLVNATADFARLGYSMEDSEMLAKTATIYKNVGDGIEDIGTASESIISTMKAFNIEAENSMDIVDAFNEVGNNFAISSTGIGEALVRSASAMAAANSTMSETIALAVAGNDVVQDPQKVGTALKTLSMRIRGAKTELEDAGESTEGMAVSVSKLREEVLLLTKNKVDIMIDDETFKSPYEILREISGVWQDIADVDQANLLELIGGKRNANVLTSILNNFKDAEAVMKTIEGDEGSAMKEQEKWLNSIEGKTQQLKATSQGLALKLLDSDTAKNAITALTKIVDAVGWLADHKGVIGGIFGVFMGGTIVKNITSVATGLLNIGSGISRLFHFVASSLGSLFHGWNAATASSTAAIMTQSEAIRTNTVATNENSAAKKLSQTATEGAAAAASGLALALGLVTAAVSVGIIAWSAYNKHVQKEIQQSQELAGKYKESSKELKDYYEEIKAAKEEINNAETDSKREEAENKLLEIQSEITKEYKNQKGQIDLINDSLEGTKKKLDDIDETNAAIYLRDNRKNNDTIEKKIDESGGAIYGIKTSRLNKYISKYDLDASGISSALGGAGYYTPNGIYVNSNTDVYQIVDSLEALYDEVEKNDKDAEVLDDISNAISHYKDIIDDVGDSVEQHALASLKIPGISGIGWNVYDGKVLRYQYEDFVSAQESLAEAINNGDNSAITEAYSKMTSISEWFEANRDEIWEKDKQVAAYLGNLFRDAIKDAEELDVLVDAKIETSLSETELNKFKENVQRFIDDTGKFDISLFDKSLSNDKAGLHQYAVEVEKTLNSLGVDIQAFSNSKLANPFMEWVDTVNSFSKELRTNVYSALAGINNGSIDATSTSVHKLAEQIKEAVKDNEAMNKAVGKLENDKAILQWFVRLIGLCGDYEEAVEKDAAKTDKFADSLNALESLGGTVDKIAKAFQNMDENGNLDFDDIMGVISALQEINGMDSSYWGEKLFEVSGNAGEVTEVLSDLTNEIVRVAIVENGWTEANEKEVEVLLRSKGVQNAAAKAKEAIAAANKDATATEEDLQRRVIATEDEYNSLCGILGQTVSASRESTNQYVIEAGALKKLGLNTQDAARIMAASQAGITGKTKEEVLARCKLYEAEAAAMQRQAAIFNASADKFQQWYDEGPDENGLYHGYTSREIRARIANNKKYAQKTLDSGSDELKAYMSAIEEIEKRVNSTNVDYTFTPGGSGSSSKSGSSGTDQYLQAWKDLVEDRKKLIDEDKWTTEQYYDWLATAYKQSGGLADTPEHRSKYAKEIREIEDELYEWEKDRIQKKIDEQDAILKNQRAQGLISEAEYQKKLGEITEEGYNELLRKVEEKDLYGVDTEERLNAETELLEKIKDAHNAAYEAEMSDLEHLRTMNLITDEQYYAKHAALVQKYYAGEKMYAEELKKSEEELYKERIDLVKKYSSAAKEAISSIMNFGKNLADAIGNLVEGIIDANSSNFDLQKKMLNHWLDMNYISEKEYYEKLKKLYTTYYKSKSIYLDEFWENQEELHQLETQFMTDDASAIENIHAKVVDMIKGELEEAKKAIDETKDKYNELIDLRRKALEDEKEENDTEKSRAEKLNEIAELTRQLNALRNDNSAAGQRKYKEVLSKLIKARKDLEDFEEEQAYKAAQEQLENEQKAMEERADAEAKVLEDKGNDNEWLVSEAWARMTGMPEVLYNQLIEWQHKTSTSIKDDIIEPFEQAREAIQGSTEDVKDLYATISEKLVHPENYYLGHALDEYVEVTDSNGNKEMITYAELRERERAQDKEIVKQKEFENYAKVLGTFAEEMADITGDSVQSVAKILNTVFPGPITDLLVDGADMFADSLGMVGISNSLLGTVAELGGIAGIIDMMNGFQDLAEGKTGAGIAIGGENIGTITALLQSINDYQGTIVDNTTLTGLINSIIGAIGNGPSNGSSVVTGITAIGAACSAILAIGTLLAGGGGAGLAGLLSAISGLGGVFSDKFDIEINGNNRLISLLIRVCEWTGNMLDKTEANGKEISTLRTLLYNGWVKVYEIVNKLAGAMTSSNMMSGFAGGLSALTGALKTLLTDSNGYSLLSGEGLGTNLLKVLASGGLTSNGLLSKALDLITTTIPNVAYGGDKTVNTYCDFTITGADAQNIADEIMKVVPQIANYTINAMLDSSGNKGVKRSAANLY